MLTDIKTFVDGPAGRIETLVQIPKDASTKSVAILCHPLPTAGGSMHNKVVYTLGLSFHSRGIATVKFNTGGTGMSEGLFDHGRREVRDLAAVVDYVCQTLEADNLWLGGFSFGSYLAHSLSRQWHFSARLLQLLLIAPPVDRYDYSVKEHKDFSLLLIHGKKDELVDSDCVDSWYEKNHTCYAGNNYICLAGASHFFHGALTELRQQVAHHLLIP